MNSKYDQQTRYDPARDADFWSDPGLAPASAGGQAAPLATAPSPAKGRKPADPIERLRRLLRGRLLLAIVLALVGATLGAALGYMSQEPVFQANGAAEIPPSQPTLGGGEYGNPNYKGFMQTAAQYIESDQMALKAMDRPEWTAVAGPMPPAAFRRNVDASYSGQDQLLKVYVKNEDAAKAVAGVRAVLGAYQDHYLAEQQRSGAGRLSVVQSELTARNAEIEAIDDEVETVSRKRGTGDLGATLAGLNADRDRLRATISNQELTLAQAERVRDRATADPETVSVTDLAAYDADLADLLERKATLLAGSGVVVNKYGPNHPRFQSIDGQLRYLDEQIGARAAGLRQRFFGMMPVLNPGPGEATQRPVTAELITSLSDSLARNRQNLNELTARINDMRVDASRLAALGARRSFLGQQAETLRDTAGKLQATGELRETQGIITLHTPLDGAVSVSKDKRSAMAIGGAILGFAVPVGLVLLLGTLDGRFRYSDDTSDTAAHAPLLGILPNLPDRLSDPNQASIAAHCVHQIRTMLQINHGSDDARAFAVTSAQRGDGKTSLALALGLSYAASGARTLLVDADLQSGGLSARLGVSGDEGIMDALTGGEMLRYVCETDVTDLAVLPIGRGAANHAGAFSPGAVRHLLEQAKRHYDVIVCDAGPVLGSIEATPVVAAVDGVLLAVSRGQSRALVNKALLHLENVGATTAGMVFNRAQARDFERSVSGMNLRGGSAAGRLAGPPSQSNGSNGSNGSKPAKNGRPTNGAAKKVASRS